MSDIPIGSPQPPPGRHAAPGGWYADPVDASRERWWDGWQWGRDTRQAESPTPGGRGVRTGRGDHTASGGGSTPVPAPGRPPAAQTGDGVPLAGWWWRALAICLDGLMLGVLVTLLSLPFLQTALDTITEYVRASVAAVEQGAPPPPQPPDSALFTSGDLMAITAVSVACGFVWHALFLRFRSATPGKMITGLRVVPLDRGRSEARLPWRSAVLRALVWVVPNLTNLLLVLRLVDVVLPLTNPRKQALHDLVAGTQVVRRR